jgi:8-oxo-dGTP diphosphatase
MKQITQIKFKDFTPEQISNFRSRKAARAVVVDADGRVALLFVAKHSYHKLPGGGVEKGEDIMAALDRECLEEIGCRVEVTGEIGMITEFRDEFNLVQDSYCYKARVVGDKSESQFTEKELSEGFEVKWVRIEDALDLIKNDKPGNYEGKFIQQRDLAFLAASREMS